jgi:hypothetical protein
MKALLIFLLILGNCQTQPEFDEQLELFIDRCIIADQGNFYNKYKVFVIEITEYQDANNYCVFLAEAIRNDDIALVQDISFFKQVDGELLVLRNFRYKPDIAFKFGFEKLDDTVLKKVEEKLASKEVIISHQKDMQKHAFCIKNGVVE